MALFFLVKETFKPYLLTKIFEKHLYEIIPSLRLILFKIIQRSTIRYSVEIVLSLA